MNSDPRNTIAHALAALCATPSSDAARAFFASLGYSGTRTFPLTGLNDFIESFDPAGELRARRKAFLDEWRSIDLLFQITDDDLTGEGTLFTETRVDKGLMRSYLFFHIVLKNHTYPRSKLAQITRQLNRLFTMPIMVLFSYGNTLSIAVINRRRNKIDAIKDVLGKVTLIHGIHCADPHRGHLDILASFSIPELARRGTVTNFDTLHAALEEVFNVELLNRIFYSKIQKWFFWAIQEIAFPHGGIDDINQRNRIAAIRMLTRVIFLWFAREKRLVPPGLFTAATARSVLKDFDPLSRSDGTYYTAILQNLFFPTLSVPLDQREFRNGRRYKGVSKHYMDHAFFRHESAFKEPGDIPRLFENIPFLNGGLFACLDYLDKKGNEIRVDGFSDTASKQPRVPNILFFGKDVPVDICAATGNPTDTAVKINGLFTILDGFKFTVTENTPVEQEIALDPELLGRIFENLLAEYNPETEKTARKQTGSFYTPRDIVDYMVGESLKAHLESALRRKLPAVTAADAREGLDILFSYTEREHAFTDAEKRALVDAIYDAAILDPACGSGAFPMGMLQKLVYVLDKLDHGHDHWKQRILADTPPAMKDQTGKWLATASADFTWKLGLVQRSIYGIDIQPFAVQIAKLRCFVSLLVDFDVDPVADNYGVPSLPNLDFKFVAANTLIKPPSEAERDDDPLKLEDPFFKDFAALAEEYFFVRDPAEKKRLQDRIEARIEEQIDTHRRRLLDAHKNTKAKFIEEDKRRLALWESYRNIFAFRNGHVGFFDPRYFFPEIKDGFDIVIGNPPYIQLQNNGGELADLYKDCGFETYARSGDIYALFYERAHQLLKSDALLCFITSNKWMRSGYGESLRKFFAEKTQPLVLIDFAGQKIFESATVDTNILIARNTVTPAGCAHKPTPCIAVVANENCRQQLSAFVQQNATPCSFNTSTSWVILNPIEQSIKAKIEKVGKPLKDWDISINYGIKTGFNDAFIINKEKRAEILANCQTADERKRTDELIRPILRGRDIKRYSFEWANLYLLFIPWHFPFHKHENIVGASDKAEREFQKQYPAIYNHLLKFKKELSARNKAEVNVRYEWYALQRWAANYWEDFSKQKIVWAETMRIRRENNERFPRFSYFPDPIVTDKTCFMAVGNDLKLALAFLNSAVGRYQFSQTVAMMDNGGYLMQKIYVEQIRIGQVDAKTKARLVFLVEKLLKSKTISANEEAEAEIDSLVFDVFKISPTEQFFMKETFARSLERG